MALYSKHGKKMGRPIKSLAERFWARVDKRGPDECWPWTGSLTGPGYKGGDGYGYLSAGVSGGYINGANCRGLRAHRVAWELAHGPVPEGLQVCHRCDNRKCCNVTHLFVGTCKDNLHDMLRKGRGNGVVLGRQKLSAEQAAEVRNLRATGIQIKVIAQRYGVSAAAISQIVHWRSHTGWQDASLG